MWAFYEPFCEDKGENGPKRETWDDKRAPAVKYFWRAWKAIKCEVWDSKSDQWSTGKRTGSQELIFKG